MKTTATLFAVLAFALAPIASGAPAVTVHGIVTTSETEVVLDIVADMAPSIALRSFGLKVSYDPQSLTLQSMGRYDGLWFLSMDGGATTTPYSNPTLVAPGCVRLLGGRFDATDPSTGVGGDGVLLGTLRFSGQDLVQPSFLFELAHPLPFENFALADGTNVDANVAGLGQETTVQFVEPAEDTDGDEIPDDYEIEHFESLAATDGSGDADGDGDSDRTEWIGGTDPNDPESNLGFSLVMQADGTRIHEWNSVAGRVYTLKKTTSLTGFAPLTGALPGVDGNHQVVEPADGQSRGFYELQVENPLSTP